MSVSAFISELIRAANDVDRLAMHERANLLDRAARTLRDYREQIDFSGSPSNDNGPGDLIYDLRRVAERVHEYNSDQIQAELLMAVEFIKIARSMLEEKQKLMDGDEWL